MRVIVTREGKHFGDNLMAALFTSILVDNGIDAVLKSPRIARFVECPQYDDSYSGSPIFRFQYPPTASWDGIGIMRRALDIFSKTFRLPKMHVTRKRVPVKFAIEEASSVDVTINSKTSAWSPYREWPHMKAFKHRLESEMLSYMDLDELGITGNRCLNYVNNSRLYVGLETGMSHYVSGVAANKGLIIQSGYSMADFWCSYDFEVIAKPIPCAPCFKRKGCEFNHACMTEITVDRVVAKVKEMLASK